LLKWPDRERQVGIIAGGRMRLPAPALHKLDRNSPANDGRGPLQARQRDVVLCVRVGRHPDGHAAPDASD